MDIILSDDLVRLLGIEIYEGIYVSEFMGVPLIIEMENILGEYSLVLFGLNLLEGVNDI